MFILESCYDGAGTITEDLIMMKDAEAGSVGEAVNAAAGRLTKAAITDSPQFILIKSTGAGANVKTEYLRVRNDQIFLADISGAAGAAALVPGTRTVAISTDGLNVDSDTLTTGKIEIISVDVPKKKARIRFV